MEVCDGLGVAEDITIHGRFSDLGEPKMRLSRVSASKVIVFSGTVGWNKTKSVSTC